MANWDLETLFYLDSNWNIREISPKCLPKAVKGKCRLDYRFASIARVLPFSPYQADGRVGLLNFHFAMLLLNVY